MTRLFVLVVVTVVNEMVGEALRRGLCRFKSVIQQFANEILYRLFNNISRIFRYNFHNSHNSIQFNSIGSSQRHIYPEIVIVKELCFHRNGTRFMTQETKRSYNNNQPQKNETEDTITGCDMPFGEKVTFP